MSDLNQVFATLEPYRVLAALSMPISTQEGSGQFTVDGHAYWFDRSKIVALDRQAPFVAGDIVDFVTHRMGRAEGIRWLLARFQGQLPAHVTFDPDALAHQLERRQRHLRSVLRLGDNLSLRPDSYPDAMVWLRRHQLERIAVLHALYVAKGRELNALKLSLGLDKGRTLPDAGTYIVLPYFGDWDRVAALRVEAVNGATEPQWWELSLTNHAWLGLQAGTPKAPQRILHGDWLDTLKHINHNHDQQGSEHHLQVKHFTADCPGRKLVSASIAETDQPGARSIIQTSRLTDRLEVTRHNRPAVDWRQHLYTYLQAQLVAEGFNLKTKMLVDELKDDPKLCNFITQKLEVQHPEWSKQFRQRTSPTMSILRGNVTLTETASGYALTKAGSAQEDLITNFLVRLDQNVWFENSDELWHAARVILSGEEFPIKFSRRASGKGDELEAVASAAVLRSGRTEVKTPVLFDMAHKKHLAAVVNHQVASAARVEGMRQLGWNTQGSRFTTPAWRATALGLEPPPSFQHPGNLLLRHFSTQPLTVSNSISPSEPLVLLAVTAAMLARSLRGVEVQPQPVFNDDAGRATLARLAASFGQQVPTAPKLNSRAGLRRPFDVDDINGLPLWLDIDTETAARIICPSFYLSEGGAPLVSTAAFGPAAAWLVQALVQSLLQRPTKHTMPAEASWHRLAFEGQQLLQERCRGPWETIEVESQAWRRLLWRCGLEKLSERFQLTGSQSIRFNRMDLPRADQQALLDESLQLDPDVKVEGLDLILPLRLFNQLVEENLGVRPTIDRLRPKAGEERLATV